MNAPATRELHTTTIGIDAELLARAKRLAAEVAGPNAASVDRENRFPAESFAALREAGLLGAYIPVVHGGAGASIAGIVEIIHELSRKCASTGMVYAMHQIQVACLVHHCGHVEPMRQVMREIAEEKLLLASATTETGVGGDLGNSLCAMEDLGNGRYRINKDAPVISYADDADAIVGTARRKGDAPTGDQVLALARMSDTKLEKTRTWDAMGMRGTKSDGFMLQMEGPMDYVVDTPYGELSPMTMAPMAHICWGAVWTGIAAEAASTAHRYLRTQARKTPGVTPQIAPAVAHLQGRYQAMRSTLDAATMMYARTRSEATDKESLLRACTSPAYITRIVSLKPWLADEMVGIVSGAMNVCGIAGYSNDGPFSLSRALRDAHSAPLMVHNERVLGNLGTLLCAYHEI